jgi:WD40 repeat protein
LENDVNSLAIEPKVFAPLLFGLLANARNGLSEKELTACMQKELGMEEEKLIRGIRLYLRQVRPFMTRREGRADYFYEAFKLAAKERYQKDTIHYNKLLSDYFNEQADPGHTLSFKGKNIRDFNELPYHLKESEHITYLEKILSTYCWIKSKIELSDVFHVIGDYDYMDLENEDYYHLELIKNTLTMSAHLLKEDTKSLPTQLWGRLKGIENPRIKELLLEVDKYTDYPWLKPRHYMDSPENALKMTLTGGGHSCFSPDGKYVASTGSENAIRVWEWKKQKEVQVLYSAGHCLCFSPDGKYIAAGYGLTVSIWEWENAKEMQKLEGHTGTVYSVCFFFDGKYIATISKDRTIRVWDWKKQKEIQRLEGHEVYCVCVSPDGKYIASTSVDRYGDTIRIWDWKKAKEIQKLEELYKKVMYLCFSSDGKYIITGSDSGISIWDWEKGIQKLKEHTNELGCICASPDGKYIALAEFFDNIVKIWNTENWTEVRRLIHPDSVGSVCFSPDGKYISSGLADSVKIWEWEKQEDKRKSGGGTAQIYSVSFSPDGKCIVFGGDQGIKIWDWETQEETQRFDDNIFVRYVCFSPDGKYIASSFNDKTIRVWEWKKQEVVQELGSTEVDSVCFSPDGKYIVSTDNSIVRIWDWKNQKEIKELETDNKSDNKCVCFSPDGKYIITGSVKAVSIWDWENAKEIQILREDFGAIESACFSPNGKYIVTGSSFGTIRVWDWENAKEIQKLELKSSDNYVRDVCFSNDGKYILMVSRHYIIRIWEWEIQTQVIVLNAEESIECCNFSNDSRQIAVGGWSGQVLMYDVENLYPSDKYVENSGDTDSNQKKKGFFSGLFKR